MGLDIEPEETACALQNYTCTFITVNGSVLLGVGIIGTILSSFSIYCLIYHVKLPHCQNAFILNIAVSDWFIAVLGIVRGLGIINPIFVGYNKTTQVRNWWCTTYTYIGSTLWMSGMPVLIPLTLDRFIAIVFPMHYKRIVSKRNSKLIIIGLWAPLILILIFDAVTLSKENSMLRFQVSHHRCVYNTARNWIPISYIYVFLPLIVILLMYAVMLYFVRKFGVANMKLLVISSLILTTSIIAYIPHQLVTIFKVKMTYEVAQVMTITVWYTNSIWNPLIYFYSNPITRRELAGTKWGRILFGNYVTNSSNAESVTVSKQRVRVTQSDTM